ncbi:MAG: S1C family serine protease [bacterium]
MNPELSRRAFAGVVGAMLIAGCASSAPYAQGQFESYDDATEYHVADRAGGFTLTVNYALYQFVPDRVAVGRACLQALTSIAHDVAEKQGKTIRPVNPQRVRFSVGRNPWSGTTSCSATAPVQYVASTPSSPPAPPADEKKARVSHGTAFAVRPDGVFLTAFHVVQDASAIKVFCPGRPYATGALIAQAVSNDLAVLRAPLAAGVPHLPLARSRSVQVGDPVFTVGFPAPGILGTAPKFTDGAVSAMQGLANEAGLLQVSVPVQPGNSGGALLNDQGQVVGVITSFGCSSSVLGGHGKHPAERQLGGEVRVRTPAL